MSANGPRVVLVPSPIGNLGDITLRALEVLKTADRIAAEDTRHSGKLLKHYEIAVALTSLHAHNEHHKVDAVLTEVAEKQLVLAVLTDAGTPGISDPGFLLVRAAVARNIPVECLPGPTAFVPALVASGLPTDRFVFEGFLPAKKGRATRLKALSAEPRTIVLYEAPHRLAKLLRSLAEHFGERPAAVARELTKVHEEIRRGLIPELALHYESSPPKGECVVVVAGTG